MPSPNEILAELKKVKYPGFTRDIVSFGIIKDIEVAHSGVTVSLTMASAKPEVVEKIVAEVKATVAAMVELIVALTELLPIDTVLLVESNVSPPVPPNEPELLY